MMKGQGVDGALPGFAGSQGRNWREQRSFFVGQLRKNSAAGTAAQAAAAAAAAAFNSNKNDEEQMVPVPIPAATGRSRRCSAQGTANLGFAGCNSELEVDTVVEEEADGMVRRLQEVLDKSGGSSRVSFHQFFMGATVNIIWRLSTGQKLAYDDPKLLDVSHKIYQFFKFLRPGPNSFLQLQFPWLMKTCERFGLKNGLNTYAGLVELLEKEVENPSMCKGTENKLISRYMNESSRAAPGSSLHGKVGRTNLVALLADIFMGGADTTNNQHEWIFLCIARFPDWQENIRNELLREIGPFVLSSELNRPHLRPLALNDLSRLPKTEAFLLEVQRLRPIAPLALPRMTTDDCELAGHKLKKDTQVLVDLSATLLDPEIFKEPLEFKPERFLTPLGFVCPDLRARIARNFGHGRRRCPGEKVARAELFVFLAKMLAAFRLDSIRFDHSPSWLSSLLGSDNSNLDPLDRGYFGLNHVPHPFTLRIAKIK